MATKKPRKRIIQEYDYKEETVVSTETQVAVVVEPLISGEQFVGIEEIVEVDSTKYSSDMFDIEAPQAGEDNKEE